MNQLQEDHSSFESKDFWLVPAALSAKVPQKLIHKNVASEASHGARQFSNERKHPVHIVDLPSFSLNMTLGGLLPGQSTNLHRHNYETIIYIIAGQGISSIEETDIEWQAGDAIYIPVWAWHSHRNLSQEHPCQYIACENAAMLQNLGGIALREEAKEA